MNEPTILPSQIHEVTVHTDGALVRRRIGLAGATGRPALVRISGLPLAAAGRAVRARVHAGGAEVLSCRLVTVTASAEAGDDHALEAAVEAANDAVEAAGQRVAAALARLRALNALVPPSRPDGVKGQLPPASPAAARVELLHFRDQQAERLGADLATARHEEQQANERLAQASAALQEGSTARAARAGELGLAAELQLRWPASGEPGWIELDYVVPGARWAPSYILRFDRALGRVALQLRGMVAQRSGEDWNGVRIACATAPLQGWCELPKLPGRRIGRAQPAPASGWRPAPSGADALFADWDAFTNRRQPMPPPRGGVFGGAVSAGVAMKDAEVEECASMPPPCPAPAQRMEKQKKMAEAAPRRSAPGMVNAAKIAVPCVVAEGVAEYREEVQAEAEPAPGHDPGADLLDFAALRLADAVDSARGRPRPDAGSDARWAQACAAAVRQSGHLDPAPPGHRPVDPARFAVRWEGTLPVDVPADGAWHVVPLAEGAGDVRLSLVVVPRESRTAFRSASLANPFDRALTAGPADVYIGDDFLLTARLPGVGAGAATVLGLGVDQTLAVARNATYSEESAGLLGGSLHLRHAVGISLHNKGGRPVAVEVRERLPQPDEQVEHCTVKQLKAEPPWQEWRPDEAELPGGRRWTLTLAAGEKRDLAYEYRIELPAKNELVGGNRREA